MTPNPSSLKVAKEIGVPGIAFGLARVPQSQRVYYGAADGKVYTVDFAEEKLKPEELLGHESYVTGVAMVGKQLVSGGYDCRLIWWDAKHRSIVKSIENAHARWIRDVQASPDGTQVASIGDDMVCRLWDAASGQMLRELKGHKPETPDHYPSMLYALAFSPDGKLLATGDKVGHIVIWNVADGSRLKELEAPGMYTWDPKQRRHSIGGIRSLAFSPDARLLAVGGMDKVGNIDHPDATARLEVFDWQKGEQTHELHSGKETRGLIERLAFHPTGDWLVGAGGGYKGFILFFDLEKKQVIKDDAAPLRVHGMALSETGDQIFAAGHGKVVLWAMS